MNELQICTLLNFLLYFFQKKGDDLNISSTQSFVNNGPGRDITIERLLEADQMSEAKCGEKSIHYLRVSATNTMIPPEYRVILLNIINNEFSYYYHDVLLLCAYLGACISNMCND